MVLDVVLSVIIVCLFIRGIFYGAINIIFGLAKIIVALLLAPRLKDYVYAYVKNMDKWLPPNILAYVISFILIIIIITILQVIVVKFLNHTGLRVVDRLLGAVVGLVEGVIVSVLIIILLLFIKDYNQKVYSVVHTSKLAYQISINTYKLNDRFPDAVKEKLDQFYYENMKKEVKDRILNKLEKGE